MEQHNIYNRKFLNPLWIIVIFCSLTEAILGTAAFKTEGNIQVALTCFVIGFPLMIAVFFFLLVWFKPGHLYAPMDYKDDKGFLKGIGNKSELPANIYLDTDNQKDIENFQAAFKQFLIVNSLKVTKEYPPEHGSFILKFKLILKDIMSKSDVKEILYGTQKTTAKKMELEQESLEIEKQKIALLSKRLQSMESLINSLENIENATIRIGPLLLIKTTDEENKFQIQTFYLDNDMIEKIEKDPKILNTPKILLEKISESTE